MPAMLEGGGSRLLVGIYVIFGYTRGTQRPCRHLARLSALTDKVLREKGRKTSREGERERVNQGVGSTDVYALIMVPNKVNPD